MKQKDFYYSTLYIYDKALADALTADFVKSGGRNKKTYLANLISLGLTAKQQRAALFDCDKTANIYGKLSAIEKRLDELQKFVFADQTEKEIFTAFFYATSTICSTDWFTVSCLTASVWKPGFTTYCLPAFTASSTD